MRKQMIFLWLLLFVAGPTACGQPPEAAQATLINDQSASVGVAALEEAPEGVKITLKVAGLPPGVHALHIHEKGKCEPPDFKSAGGHFNPYGKRHGVKNPEGHHAGDLPNLTVGSDGTAQVEIVARGVTLRGGANSLFHPEGTSLVIHAGPDDDVTDPAGNAGARIACGEITH